MSKKPPSRDEALEAIDFIVNVLKEHEKDLDKLINELGTEIEQMGDTGELSTKVEKVEDRLTTLQEEIANLINYLSTQHASPAPSIQSSAQNTQPADDKPVAREIQGPPVILRCKQWEDFLTLASQAQTVSFMYREAEKSFQVDALKSNQVVTYNGELPKPAAMLKTWLSKLLGVEEKRIMEGVLAIS